MAEFQTIAKVGEIPAGEGRAYPIDGTIVAVFNVGGEYTAINDVCPHMGASLAGGYIEGNSVTCPWHAWRFSVKDGTWLDNPKSKIANACYPVRVVGEDIQIRMPDSSAQQSQQPS
jgi:nitrite reductase (NADH) small subunit